jgi:hypothetical protein
MDFSDEVEESGKTGLSETTMRDVKFISNLPGFAAEEIDRDEFEVVWKEAREQAASRGGIRPAT